jgi:DNA-binding NtrC family response regulator
MKNVLIVDDELNLRASLERILRKEGLEVETAGSASEALALVEAHTPDLLLCDVQMPGMNGLRLLEQLRVLRPSLPVIVMTGYGNPEMVIDANRLGAVEFVRKPFDPAGLLRVIHEALAVTPPVVVPADDAAADDDLMVGECAAMYQVYQTIGRVAATDVSVLIRGETGTGKELVARAIHRASGRRAGPFLALNCVAIPETLLESELFGHERGAFTGAAARRPGRFELAAGGTLFLDEIGDMQPAMQGKLLRVLQERQFERLGGQQPITVDVRLLAATNADLEAGLARGRFRPDLYQRLNGVTLWLPPLRERGDDVVQLAQHFLQRSGRLLGIAPPPLSESVIALLRRYHWPGNVRELAHLLHRALILYRGRAMNADDLTALLDAPATSTAHAAPAARPQLAGMTLEQAERELILQTIAATGGNKKEAARVLGISRNALYEKMRRHGMLEAVSNQDTAVS